MAFLLASLVAAGDCPDGLVSYWTFDDRGAPGEDTSGTNQCAVSGPFWTGDGIAGGALVFDGADDHVDCGAGPSLDTGSTLTVSAWIRPYERSLGGSVQAIISKWPLTQNITSEDAWTGVNVTALDGMQDYKGYIGTAFDGRYLYLVPNHDDKGQHGRIVRYDTSKSFGEAASWEGVDIETFAGMEGYRGYHGAVFDGRYVYLVPIYNYEAEGNRHGRIARYDTRGPFDDGGSWEGVDITTLSGMSDYKGYVGGTFDGRYLYLVPYTDASGGGNAHGRVARYDTAGEFGEDYAWSGVDITTFPGMGEYKGYYGAVFDGRYVYLVPSEWSGLHGRVARYDTTRAFGDASSWEGVDITTFPDMEGYRCFHGGAFDGRYLYLTPEWSGHPSSTNPFHGKVAQYDTTAPFTEKTSWTGVDIASFPGMEGYEGYIGAVFDGRYLYLVPSAGSYGKVARFDTAQPFHEEGSWDGVDITKLSGMNEYGWYAAAVFDGRYLYLVEHVDDSDQALVARYDTSVDSSSGYRLTWSQTDRSGVYAGGPFGVGFEVITDTGHFGAWGNKDIKPGEWHFLTGVYDGSLLRLYVDGLLIAENSEASGTIIDSSAPLQVGTLQPSGRGQFEGTIDEVTVLNGALTETEVRALHNRGRAGQGSCGVSACGNGIPEDGEECDDGNLLGGDFCSSTCKAGPATDGLVGRWTFDDRDHLTRDVLGNEAGTVHGALWSRDDRLCGVLGFDGFDDYVHLPPHDLGMGDWTFTAWVHPAPSGSLDGDVFNLDGGKCCGGDFRCFIEDNRLKVMLRNADGKVMIDGDNAYLSDQKSWQGWHHITYQRSGNDVVGYMDGEKQLTKGLANTGPGVWFDGDPILIGHKGDVFFDGMIGEVDIHDRALSEAEIKARYNEGMLGQTDCGPDLSGLPAGFLPVVSASAESCPEGMARIDAYWGSYCIDLYEAFDDEGKAGSAPGKVPWVSVNWTDAKAACEAAGKRLCKDFEWTAACNLGGEKYYLIEEESGERHDCYTLCEGCPGTTEYNVETGTHARCRSDAGVYDMVGNVWEWTDTIVPDDSWSGGEGEDRILVDEVILQGTVGSVLGDTPEKYGDDVVAYHSPEIMKGYPFMRGGTRDRSSESSPFLGCFFLSVETIPSHEGQRGGFRCCSSETGPPDIRYESLEDALIDRNRIFMDTFEDALDLTRRKRYREAIAQFRECLSIDPDNPNALTNIAILQELIGLPQGFLPVVNASTTPCPAGMVRIDAHWGSYCIDRYEAYDAGPNHVGERMAGSAPGKVPWVSIDWTGAKDACEAAGKRLCKDIEWIAACDLGGEKYYLTEEESRNDERYGCFTYCSDEGCSTATTGSHPACTSARGVYDMVGNVGEWTDALVPDNSWKTPYATVGSMLDDDPEMYGDDWAYANAADEGDAFLRGGEWVTTADSSSKRGCFYLSLGNPPSRKDSKYGFRCCSSVGPSTDITYTSLEDALVDRNRGFVDAFEQAMNLTSENMYKEAIAAFRECLSIAPGNPNALTNIAILQELLGIPSGFQPAMNVSVAPCSVGMARIDAYWGSYCIDKYEAFNDGGEAGSAPGKQPWVNVDWNNAQNACTAAGKRLCRDEEWMAACDLDGQKYYLTEEEYNETYGCHTYGSSLDDTGSHAKCRSDAGVFDMIGSVWEWTDALVPSDTWGGSDGYIGENAEGVIQIQTTKSEKYGGDWVYVDGAEADNAFQRGGGWLPSTDSDRSPRRGCFLLSLTSEPSRSRSRHGFRCCKGDAQGSGVPSTLNEVLVDRNQVFVDAFNEARDLAREEKYTEAIAKFQECLAIDPGNANALANIAILQELTLAPTHTPQLIAHWRFDGTGTTATDSAGDHDGTINGGAARVDGVAGTALEFDGVDDHVKIPYSGSINLTGAFTIEAWVNPVEFDLIRAIFNWASDGHGITIERNGKGGIRMGIGHGPRSYDWRFSGSTSDLPTGTWSHVVGVFDGSYIRLYVNGEPGGRSTASKPPASSSRDLVIGNNFAQSRQEERWWKGLIDELRIYNYALEGTTVRQHYNDEKPAATEACLDGTAYGACSSTKPKYCDGGALVDKPSACGCPPGYGDCDGGFTTGCETRLSTDENCGSCGNACSDGMSCADGTCTCPAGTKDCSGQCVNVLTNPANCGDCGKVCPQDHVCSIGTCLSSCPVGTTDCSGACVDLQNNTDNCGGCKNACIVANGTAGCDSGICAIDSCKDGFDDCDDLYATGCEALLSTDDDCGACGNTCSEGTGCLAGNCTCTGGGTACNGTCADLMTDTGNCGSCGRSCLEGELCTEGVCTVVDPCAGKGCGDQCRKGGMVCDSAGNCIAPVGDGEPCACHGMCTTGLVCGTGGNCESSEACGNGKCEDDAAHLECVTCPLDCSRELCQGNGRCNKGVGEHCENSPGDCPCQRGYVCEPTLNSSLEGGCYRVRCGDSTCHRPDETKDTCCRDCPCPKGFRCDERSGTCIRMCGDGECTADEDSASCCVDCGCPTSQVCDREAEVCLEVRPSPSQAPAPSPAPACITSSCVQAKEEFADAEAAILETKSSTLWRLLIRLDEDELKDLELRLSMAHEKINDEEQGEAGLTIREVERTLDPSPLDIVLNWIDIIGLLGILASGLFLAKRYVLGVESVTVQRGVEREGALIKVGIKVMNDSTFALRSVAVDLEVPDALCFQEPASKFYQLGDIEPGDFQSAIYKLYPVRCVSGNISGSVTYKDGKGRVRTKVIRPAEVSSICPMLEPFRITREGFSTMSAGLSKDEQLVRYTAPSASVFSIVKQRVAAMYPVVEAFSPSGTGEGWYAARGKYSKKAILLIARIEAGKVSLQVFSENPEMGTGLLAELAEEIGRAGTSQLDGYRVSRDGGYGGAGQWRYGGG